jgi:hypothetical protein
VIQNLPNRQAHDQLYERSMNYAGEYDFFIKLDADMVILSQHLFANFVTEFEQRPQIDLLTILVHDYFTDRQVEELEAYPDVVLCHHDVEQFTETKKNPLRKERFTLARDECQYSLAEEPYFLVKNYICNPTVMLHPLRPTLRPTLWSGIIHVDQLGLALIMKAVYRLQETE